MDAFVARQAIFDRQQQVFAYELLFRSCLNNYFDNPDPTAATSEVMANSVFAVGLESILLGRRGFINFGRNLLMGNWTTILPNKMVGIEVLETVEPDSEVLEVCRALRARGYMVALDDFICSPAYEPLTKTADLIKVDVRNTPRPEQERLIKRYSGRGIKMLAEKVETPEEFDWAKKTGYDYFQGYFFAKPQVMKARKIPVLKMNQVKLLQELQKPTLDFNRLDQLIRADVSLSYNILRYANSAAFSCSAPIQSIRQALMLIGENEARKWISIATLPSLALEKPCEVAIHAMVRARFCESVAKLVRYPAGNSDPFLMGLFSLLDAMLDRPLGEIISELNLSREIRDALLRTDQEPNTLGKIYELVMMYELANWEALPPLEKDLSLPPGSLPEVYRDACAWAGSLGIAGPLPAAAGS